MGEAHGIEVAAADEAAWDAAMSSFLQGRAGGSLRQTLSLVAGRSQTQPLAPDASDALAAT